MLLLKDWLCLRSLWEKFEKSARRSLSISPRRNLRRGWFCGGHSRAPQELPFVSERLEDRVLPAGTDIVLSSVTANGKTTLTVDYEILDTAVTGSMSLQFLQSTDDVADGADAVLSTVTISDPADLTVGTHTLSFKIGTQVLLPGAGKPEVATDYFLLAVADPTDAITEPDGDPLNEDNTKPFMGAYATSTGIQAHTGSQSDTVTLTYPSTTTGNVTISLSGSIEVSYSLLYGSSSGRFRVRTHGDDDTVDIVNPSNLAAWSMFELGGDGDDILNGASGADTLHGGAGDDQLSGGKGNDSLDGGDGVNTLVESANVNFTLTDTRLSGIGTDTLANLQIANLSNLPGDTAPHTMTVGGWTGGGTLARVNGTGANNTIHASKPLGNIDFTLSDTELQTSDGMILALAGFSKAQLTGGTGASVFTVDNWTGTGSLTGSTGTDTLAVTRDANLTLTTSSLTTTDGVTSFGVLKLSGIEVADLIGGPGDNIFNVSAWSGTGSLTGGGGQSDTLTVTRNANFTLSDTQLVASSNLNLTLTEIFIANLTGGSSANTFTVSNWTGEGTLDGLLGADRIVAARDVDMTLTNTELLATGFGTLTLNTVDTANLSGGAGDNLLFANQFTLGSVTLQGNGGNDVLLGGTKHDSLVGGAGRDLLIGGAGVDTLIGDTTTAGTSGEDILIGGTTSFSGGASATPLDADLFALQEIMAEWGRTDEIYTNRVANLETGGGSNGTTVLDSTTVQNDAGAADRLRGSAPPTPNLSDLDWFFKSTGDVMEALVGIEIGTMIL